MPYVLSMLAQSQPALPQLAQILVNLRTLQHVLPHWDHQAALLLYPSSTAAGDAAAAAALVPEPAPSTSSSGAMAAAAASKGQRVAAQQQPQGMGDAAAADAGQHHRAWRVITASGAFERAVDGLPRFIFR